MFRFIERFIERKKSVELPHQPGDKVRILEHLYCPGLFGMVQRDKSIVCVECGREVIIDNQ